MIKVIRFIRVIKVIRFIRVINVIRFIRVIRVIRFIGVIRAIRSIRLLDLSGLVGLIFFVVSKFIKFFMATRAIRVNDN